MHRGEKRLKLKVTPAGSKIERVDEADHCQTGHDLRAEPLSEIGGFTDTGVPLPGVTVQERHVLKTFIL
jgi:hypothetical protein